MKDIRPIRTQADYDWAITEITRYFDNEPAPGTPEGDRFEVLLALVGAYEDEHYPIEAPDPVEAIKAYMELQGHDRGDLVAIIGSQSRATEILRKQRRLTLEMVHRLSTRWHIPAEMLVAPYHLSTDKTPGAERLQAKTSPAPRSARAAR